MNNKAKLYRVAWFAILTFLLLIAFSYMVDLGVRHSNDEGFKKVNNIITARIDPDIIAFGSSVGEKSFNSNLIATETNSTVYNSCIDGTNYEQYKGLMEYYNAYSSKKSLVLLFESYFSLQKLPAISSIERFSAYLNCPQVYNMLFNIDPGITWKSRYIPLYKNTVVDHTYYKAAFNGWKSYLLKKNSRDSLNGFVPHYTGWEIDQDRLIDESKPFKIVMDEDVLTSYVKMITQLQKNGKQVIIILPPIFERLYKEKADFRPLRMAFDRVSGLTGCVFLDFSASVLSRDKANFYNTNHLNYNGAVLFSTMLADSLKRRYPAYLKQQ